jgi:cell division protein FtsL
LKRQISEQNKKIDGLEKEMAVLSQHNRYLLLYIGAANEFPGKVEKKVSE